MENRGAEFGARLEGWRDIPGVADVRGQGLLWGVELETREGRPDAERAFAVVRAALGQGVLLLGGGTRHDVLQFTPPFCLGEAQRDAALDAVRVALLETAPGGGARAGGRSA